MPKYDTFTWERSERWVRGVKGGTTVVDSPHPVLVREPGAHGPRYAFPKQEVRTDLLRPSVNPPAADGREYYDLAVDGEVVPNAAWRYPDDKLPDHIAIAWFGAGGTVLDHWYEEDEEVYAVPRDPYHRVDPIRGARHLRVERNGQVVAETERPILLFETGIPVRYYIPPEDVNFDLLEPTELSTGCPYKGFASYWSFRDGGSEVAWAYLDPIASVTSIKGYVSFYDNAVDITVDKAESSS